MGNSLAVLGAGGHGKVVADIARASGEWEDIVFFDDGYPVKGKNSGWDIIGTYNDLLKYHSRYDGVIVGFGSNKARLIALDSLKVQGARIISVTHPMSIISPSVSVLEGSVVCAAAVINADAVVGRGCIINTGAIIEHDCALGDGVHISPNVALAGGTIVGACSWVGIGAVTKQQVIIGSNAVVGAGSVVLEAVADGVTVAGNPARVLKTIC